MDDNDINEFIPSILNPRSQRKHKENNLSQSTHSRISLSLKKKNVALDTSIRRLEMQSIVDYTSTPLWPSIGTNRPHIKKLELDQSFVTGKGNEHHNSTSSQTVENKWHTSQNKRKLSMALQIGFKKKKRMTDDGISNVLILKSSHPKNLINFTTITSQNLSLGKCHQTAAKTQINKGFDAKNPSVGTVRRLIKNKSPLKQSSILSFLQDSSRPEDDVCSNKVVKLEVENDIKTNKEAHSFKSPWVHLADADYDKVMQKGDNFSPKYPSIKLSKTNNLSTNKSSISGLHGSDVLKKPSTTTKNTIARRYLSNGDVQSNKPRASSLSSPKKTSLFKSMPSFKIVSGTQFAVDAFAYGDIENVVAYFLTHFHSDHYMGLKKSFKKPLYCSKITADLCISKLGVNPDHIAVLRMDETINIDGVDVTTIEANHCPGSIMLLFTLPSGKSLLHCGDFRACPAMESYPALWNRDIHTIYLDTTYCNPRYDFPTQDESIDMAYQILQEKENALKKKGKDFSSVLVVCGTYTIGKERFFLGLAQRMGLNIFASPEKDKMLRVVQGNSYSRHSPLSCQLHVLSMRDLNHARLKEYMDNLGGVFKEVIAFKPSGWENCKHKALRKDNIAICGIPYSEHSSFSEMIRFVKFLRPKLVIPTVDIAGGLKEVQKYFPCPIGFKEDVSQTKLSNFFAVQPKQARGGVNR